MCIVVHTLVVEHKELYVNSERFFFLDILKYQLQYYKNVCCFFFKHKVNREATIKCDSVWLINSTCATVYTELKFPELPRACL